MKKEKLIFTLHFANVDDEEIEQVHFNDLDEMIAYVLSEADAGYVYLGSVMDAMVVNHDLSVICDFVESRILNPFFQEHRAVNHLDISFHAYQDYEAAYSAALSISEKYVFK